MRDLDHSVDVALDGRRQLKAVPAIHMAASPTPVPHPALNDSSKGLIAADWLRLGCFSDAKRFSV